MGRAAPSKPRSRRYDERRGPGDVVSRQGAFAPLRRECQGSRRAVSGARRGLLHGGPVTILVPWLRAFALTQLVEAPIYMKSGKISWWEALVPSAVTHPFVWFVFPKLQEHGISYLGMAVAAEAFAVLVEAALVRLAFGVPGRRAFWVSVLANASSVAVGLVLREFGLV